MTARNTLRIVDITEGSLVSKLLRHGSAYFISSAILNFTAFLLVPISTRIFSEAEYGAIATVNAIYKLAEIPIGLYLHAAYSVFYHEYKDNPQTLRQYTSTLFWFIITWGSCVVVLGLFLATRRFLIDIPVWPVLALAFLVSLLNQLGLVSISYLQQNHRSILLTSFTLINLFLHISVMLITVIVFDLGLTGKYLGLLSGAGVSALISSWVLYREGLLGLHFSWPVLKESLFFSIPLMPNVAAGWVTSLSDRILLTLYGSLAETGIYSVGYGLGKGIMLFSMPISMVYGPMMLALLKKDPENAKTRIERFVPYFFMFMLWVCLALALFAREIVTLMTTGNYVSASAVVPIVLFAYFLGSQYIPFTNILSYKRKTWVISSGAVLQAMFNFGANLIFIPLLGKMAAAWTTVIAMAIYTAWMFFWSQRVFHLQLDYKRILMASVITGGIGGAVIVLMPLTVFAASYAATIGLKVSLLLGALIAMWVSGCVLPADKQRVKTRLVQSHFGLRIII